MTGGDPLLAAQQLCAGRGTPLLRGVDLEFRAAQSWFVLGRNGSGKSTLLATLVGLLRPLGGAVRWHGDLAGRRRLGYVPQEQRFAPPLPCTVAEFVALGLPDREARAAVRDCVAAALAAMEIGGLAARAVQTLSVGQRRRAMVARALARRPRLLLLDEPTANLDGHGAALLARDLERLREQQRLCVVHVAHDLGLARRFATHVALVDGGAVVAGAADALLADPRLAGALGQVQP